MIIEDPTYEKLINFLGRHISYTNRYGEIITGCLVCVVDNDSLWIGIDAGGKLKGNLDPVWNNLSSKKAKYIGPRSILALWTNEFSELTVHEPVKNFTKKTTSNKWWVFGTPILIGVLRKL